MEPVSYTHLNVCGLKWTAHGGAVAAGDVLQSRIQATVVINDRERGIPLAVMNGTDIGAARTGAVTATALRYLAPVNTEKVALCGAGGQAERQLQAVLCALPQVKAVSYTHLDVYKRQGKAVGYHGGYRLPLVFGIA